MPLRELQQRLGLKAYQPPPSDTERDTAGDGGSVDDHRGPSESMGDDGEAGKSEAAATANRDTAAGEDSFDTGLDPVYELYQALLSVLLQVATCTGILHPGHHRLPWCFAMW